MEVSLRVVFKDRLLVLAEGRGCLAIVIINLDSDIIIAVIVVKEANNMVDEKQYSK